MSAVAQKAIPAMVSPMVRSKPSYARSQQNGFSYLWLLFMIAFISLGLTVGTELQATATRREQEKMLISIGRQFRSAIESYYNTPVGNAPQYPKTLNDLLKDSRFQNKRHLRQIFIDPITGKDEWGLILREGRIVGVHSLSEKMPLKQDNFEPSEEKFAHKKSYTEWRFIAAGAPDLPVQKDINMLNPSASAPATSPSNSQSSSEAPPPDQPSATTK